MGLGPAERKQSIRIKKKKRRKGNRGKKQQRKHDERLKIFYCNVRGIKSKRERIEEIVESCAPNILVFNETFNENEEVFQIDGYRTYTKNRIHRKGGGLAVMIQTQWAKKTVEIKDDPDEEQEDLLVIKIHKGKSPLNIMTTYGKQEGYKDEVTQQMAVWDQKIVEIQRRSEHLNLSAECNTPVTDNFGQNRFFAEMI